MDVFGRYSIRHLFLGFAAAVRLLLPLSTASSLIDKLDDVNPDDYHWTQAVSVVLMALPHTLVELSPLTALLGGIVGLGQLSKNSGLTVIHSTGFPTFRITPVTLAVGILWTVSLGAIDEWVASPLQQQAPQIKSTATALGEDDDITSNTLWARRGNEFVTVGSLNEQDQPVGVGIFHYHNDLSLESYIFARSASIEDDKTWILHGVSHRRRLNGKETLKASDSLAWQSASTSMDLEELLMSGNTLSARQLNHYIHYLQEIEQPSSEYRLALWEKLGQPIPILMMILLTVPFTFSAPCSSGMGSRLAVGVIVDLFTWISYQITVNLGLLFALSALVTASGSPVASVLMVLSLVYWYDGQH